MNISEKSLFKLCSLVKRSERKETVIFFFKTGDLFFINPASLRGQS